MVRQLHFATTDLLLHSVFEETKQTPYELDREVAANSEALAPEEFDRFLNGFSHIFAGGYSAGYYSYKWAEVLSADCFAAFEEVGLENEEEIQDTGRRFRDTVLALGGGLEPMEVFNKFRGREPSVEPLLRHAGLRPAM
uniref:Peptidase M3A/M3B catalytic domain-containing protein n=1 Tax=Lotharella oceanica TaxID=641309 RepID=A0A7S2TEJ9_9EUKA|mmetsp:Transcript_10397/g.19904  ORF Transcript_10397/g.19904 Transcript_10397/m.19904 type:complete len:139 (+) Transcript_10397:54-470(+)